MNTKSDIPQPEKHQDTAARILERLGAVVIFPVVMAVVALVAAGRLNWIWAWVYLGMSLAHALIVGPMALRAHPETGGQSSEPETTWKWDAGSVLHLLVMYIVLPAVAGLDERFGWAGGFSIPWRIAGAAGLATGWGLAAWAIVANPYVWSAEPIQRGQTVCSSGPYQLVRHPGYAGVLLQGLGVPILLGSLWALIPGITAAVCMISATLSEDRMLQVELPGYRDYAQQVRYRLFPGIW